MVEWLVLESLSSATTTAIAATPTPTATSAAVDRPVAADRPARGPVAAGAAAAGAVVAEPAAGVVVCAKAWAETRVRAALRARNFFIGISLSTINKTSVRCKDCFMIISMKVAEPQKNPKVLF